MAGLTTVLLLQHALIAADANSYHAALREAETKQRPLLVLVGAEWCPGCRTMKNSVLPQLARRGGLSKVSLATVDADKEPEVASQLMSGNIIPQLVAFSKSEDGTWHREQIIGTTNESSVRELIDRATAAQRKSASGTTNSAVGN
jgi:thioredoxin-like negative regulator of GroEL